ncbi:MAG TPA: hypothetical protein VFT34_01915 [Verrucomicrobiae bacterium]|nr:hypothetical protein [Verrucomicrobiae bacterium]
MKNALSVSLILLAVGLPVYLLYWNLFRPVLIERLKYRLFKARDDLRLMVIRGEIGEKEKAYPILERWCNKAIAVIEWVDFAEIMATKVDKATVLEVERDLQIIDEANVRLRKVFSDLNMAMIGATCVNSPGFLLIIAPFVVFAVAIFWFGQTKAWAYRRYNHVLGSIYVQPA